MPDPRLGSLVPARPFFRCLGTSTWEGCPNVPIMTIAMRGKGQMSRYSCAAHQEFWVKHLSYVCTCCTQDVPPRVTLFAPPDTRKR